MKVFLRSAGGIGNVRMEGQVDTSDLAEDLAQRVEKVLAPKELKGLEGLAAPRSTARTATSGPFTTDAQKVEISVQTATAAAQRFQLDEAELSDEMLEVLDALRFEITRRKAVALGRKVP